MSLAQADSQEAGHCQSASEVAVDHGSGERCLLPHPTRPSHLLGRILPPRPLVPSTLLQSHPGWQRDKTSHCTPIPCHTKGQTTAPKVRDDLTQGYLHFFFPAYGNANSLPHSFTEGATSPLGRQEGKGSGLTLPLWYVSAFYNKRHVQVTSNDRFLMPRSCLWGQLSGIFR